MARFFYNVFWFGCICEDSPYITSFHHIYIPVVRVFESFVHFNRIWLNGASDFILRFADMTILKNMYKQTYS